MRNNVSLQINLAPGDYRHVQEILPHQLKILGGQVDEILLIIDTQPGKGRFAAGWQENEVNLNKFINECIKPAYPVTVIPVNYTPEMVAKVGQFFFDKKKVPSKDFRGGPFYCYFFGLYIAVNDLVLHLDSDMFLGGGSQTWIDEAVGYFKSDPSCLILSPLPGPPHPDDILVNQQVIDKMRPNTYQLAGMSTRIFMIDKSKFVRNKLKISKPSARNQVKAMAEGNPNTNLPEVIIAEYMVKSHFKRIDFLGESPGLWSLHPPYRSETFYTRLKEILKRVETNSLPGKQSGFYDIIDEVCDWTEARNKLKNYRWWKKLLHLQ